MFNSFFFTFKQLIPTKSTACKGHIGSDKAIKRCRHKLLQRKNTTDSGTFEIKNEAHVIFL